MSTAKTRRAPTGAAVLQPEVTAAITQAVLDELAEYGYGRLSMEAVAKRAAVSKSALYRRWPSKHHMVLAIVSELSVPLAEVPDTGSLHGDLHATLHAVAEWLTHPRISRILPDLIAEGARNQALGQAIQTSIAAPRRARAEAMFRRAIQRGELPAGIDMEMAIDLLAAPIYWRLHGLHATLEPDYLDRVATVILHALSPT